jgi:hypothetical protein
MFIKVHVLNNISCQLHHDCTVECSVDGVLVVCVFAMNLK